jgi:Fe-S cluster biogenesis protein NfuA
MVSDTDVGEVVRGLQALVEADGGSFEFIGFDHASGILGLRLSLEQVTCEECVLPPEMLHEIATSFVQKLAPEIKVVDLEDPRASRQGP